MRRKSKFVTFILSFIPGLSHFYLGYADRGFLYLLILGMLCVGTIGLAILTGADKFLTLLVGIPIIWLVALIDAFSIINTLRYGDSSEVESNFIQKKQGFLIRRSITLALSIIPGAGHVPEATRKGLIFMAGFFFAYSSWVG